MSGTQDEPERSHQETDHRHATEEQFGTQDAGNEDGQTCDDHQQAGSRRLDGQCRELRAALPSEVEGEGNYQKPVGVVLVISPVAN